MIDDASGDFALPVILKTDGAKLAVAEINAKGGVLGKKLELIHYDGQSDVRRHQEFAQRCIWRITRTWSWLDTQAPNEKRPVRSR